MSGKTHLVFGDAHAHYQHNNDRAEWLGNLIKEERPDVVIDLGDTGDFPSLSGYDRGRRSFQGRSYKQDVESHNDFQDRLWSTVRSGKKKLPVRFKFRGNHEHRIYRAVDLQPELEGTVDYADLQENHYYDEVIDYVGNYPGTACVDGVNYGHYMVSGIMGRPISGEHPAYSLLSKRFSSSTVGHGHIMDYCVRTRTDGRKIMGLALPMFCDFNIDWAGEINRLYSRGVVIKRNVEDGIYDLSIISMEELRQRYAKTG